MKHSEKYFNSKIIDSVSLITEYIPLSDAKRYGEYCTAEGKYERERNPMMKEAFKIVLEEMDKEDNLSSL